MKVSVLINNYNYASFIEECLSSVTKQSRPADEIIIIDDGSTDDSVKRIKAHPLNVICIEKENGGQYSAMQVATQIATGDILCYLDSDDTWSPDYLKEVCAAFQSIQQPDFVYTGLEKFGNEHGPHHLNSESQHSQLIPQSQQLLLARRVYVGGPTSANSIKSKYARQLFKDASPERLKDYRLCADQILVLGSSLIGCRKLQLPNRLVNYRVHSSNGFHNKETDKTEQNRNQDRFLRLRDQLSSQLNIKLNPSLLSREFQEFLESGGSQQNIIRFYLRSPKELNLSPILRTYWKARLNLIYRISKLK
jgi:glycosyltransferase involved in cell wall biosynthesis